MIISVKVDNFLVYSNEVELNLVADMRIKKFLSNVYSENKFNILKCACIYGPNNSGKTCLVRAINSIKNVLLGEVAEVPANLFTNSKTCSFEIAFFFLGKAYKYSFKFDSTISNNCKKGFVYECLKEFMIDKYGNFTEKKIFLRDSENNNYECPEDPTLEGVLELISNDNILIYSLNTTKYPLVEKWKRTLRAFAEKIEIVEMNSITVTKTLLALKNNEPLKGKIVELIKLSDLDIDDFLYLDNNPKTASNEQNFQNEREKFTTQLNPYDMLKLTSIHKGVAVQSFRVDSIGTRKIVSLASYIVDALFNGKILVVDELDSSLHFKLTRALVALFNSELNENSQLIFTAHDVTLLDCKRLFRKDQIWFASKDEESENLYSLSDFNSQEDKIRSESDLFDKYSSGILGAIPEPNCIELLLNKNTGE